MKTQESKEESEREREEGSHAAYIIVMAAISVQPGQVQCNKGQFHP